MAQRHFIGLSVRHWARAVLATAAVLLSPGVLNPALADLHIKSVERIGEETPVSRGDTVSVRVSVFNDGSRTRNFAIAQVGGCEAGEVFNIGEDQFVKDGDTKEIEFPICVNQEGISGRFTPSARYATSIFLRDIEGGGAPLFGIFEDGTPSDNWANVSFPAARLRTLTVTLSNVVVHDDMDSVSVGDWHVFFNVANFAGSDAPRYGRRIDGPAFPASGGARNVSTGETVSIGLRVNVPAISETEQLVVAVSALDCDGDEPLAFSIERSTADCTDEEEFWEFTGAHDRAGPAIVRLSPAQWRRGGSFTSRPVPEFTANISVSVAP
jgi:hypothetical protein